MEIPSDPPIRRLQAALQNDGAVIAVYVFGSHASGRVTRLSDIDIGILLDRAIQESGHFALRLDFITRLMEILGTDKVDVVILNRAPLHLAYQILSRGILILDRDSRKRAEFEADRIGRFLDFKPFLAVQLNSMKAHLKRGTFFD